MIKRAFKPLTPALLALVMVFTANCSGTQSDVIQGYNPPATQKVPPRFGITETTMPDANTLALLEESGAQILKCDGELAVRWNLMETPSGSYDWMAVDERLAVLTDTGLELVVCVYAWPDDLSPAARVLDANQQQRWREFVTALAERYDGDGEGDGPAGVVIDTWQFEDEADATWAGQAAGYADLFRIAAQAVRDAAPEARVMMAGASTRDEAPKFFEQVLARLAEAPESADVFDLFDCHSLGAGDRSYQQPGRQAVLYRQMLEHFGFSDVAVAVTETGTWSGDPAGEEWPAQTERQQAIDLVRRYVHGLANGVEFMNWLSFREWNDPDAEPAYLNRLGLVNNPIHTGAVGPKVAYEAYHRLVEELGDARVKDEISGLPDGFHGVVFVRDYYDCLVLWNDAANGNPRLVTVPWPYSSGQVNRLVRGEQREDEGWVFPARDGFLDVRVTNTPVLIVRPDY